MGKKARNLRSEIRRQKQGGGKWEIDQEITSLGFIQMKGIFVKILRNIHIVHNMNWNHKREITTESFYFTRGAYSNKIIFTPISCLVIQQEISIAGLGFE